MKIDSPLAWEELGNHGGGVVRGIHYDTEACSRRAAEFRSRVKIKKKSVSAGSILDDEIRCDPDPSELQSSRQRRRRRKAEKKSKLSAARDGTARGNTTRDTKGSQLGDTLQAMTKQDIAVAAQEVKMLLDKKVFSTERSWLEHATEVAKLYLAMLAAVVAGLALQLLWCGHNHTP